MDLPIVAVFLVSWNNAIVVCLQKASDLHDFLLYALIFVPKFIHKSKELPSRPLQNVSRSKIFALPVWIKKK